MGWQGKVIVVSSVSQGLTQDNNVTEEYFSSDRASQPLSATSGGAGPTLSVDIVTGGLPLPPTSDTLKVSALWRSSSPVVFRGDLSQEEISKVEVPEATNSISFKTTTQRLEELDTFWLNFREGFDALSPEEQAQALVALRSEVFSDNLSALWGYVGQLEIQLPQLEAESRGNAPRIVRRIGPEIDTFVPDPDYVSWELREHQQKLRTLRNSLLQFSNQDWETLVSQDLTGATHQAEAVFEFLWQTQVTMISEQVEAAKLQVAVAGSYEEQSRLEEIQTRLQAWQERQKAGIHAEDPMANFNRDELEAILQDLKEIGLHRSLTKLVSQKEQAISKLKNFQRWERAFVETFAAEDSDLYASELERIQVAENFYGELEKALKLCEASDYQAAADLMAQTLSAQDMEWLEDALGRWEMVQGAGCLMITVVAGMASGGAGFATARWVTALGNRTSAAWGLLGSTSGVLMSGFSFTAMQHSLMLAWTGESQSELNFLEESIANTLMFGAMHKSMKLMGQYLYRGQQEEVLQQASKHFIFEQSGKTFDEVFQQEWRRFLKQKPLVDRMGVGLSLFQAEYGVMLGTEMSKAAYLQAKEGKLNFNSIAARHNTPEFHAQMLLSLLAIKVGNRIGTGLMEPFKPSFKNLLNQIEGRIHNFFYPQGPGLGPQLALEGVGNASAPSPKIDLGSVYRKRKPEEPQKTISQINPQAKEGPTSFIYSEKHMALVRVFSECPELNRRFKSNFSFIREMPVEQIEALHALHEVRLSTRQSFLELLLKDAKHYDFILNIRGEAAEGLSSLAKMGNASDPCSLLQRLFRTSWAFKNISSTTESSSRMELFLEVLPYLKTRPGFTEIANHITYEYLADPTYNGGRTTWLTYSQEHLWQGHLDEAIILGRLAKQSSLNPEGELRLDKINADLGEITYLGPNNSTLNFSGGKINGKKLTSITDPMEADGLGQGVLHEVKSASGKLDLETMSLEAFRSLVRQAYKYRAAIEQGKIEAVHYHIISREIDEGVITFLAKTIPNLKVTQYESIADKNGKTIYFQGMELQRIRFVEGSLKEGDLVFGEADGTLERFRLIPESKRLVAEGNVGREHLDLLLTRAEEIQEPGDLVAEQAIYNLRHYYRWSLEFLKRLPEKEYLEFEAELETLSLEALDLEGTQGLTHLTKRLRDLVRKHTKEISHQTVKTEYTPSAWTQAYGILDLPPP